MEEKIFYAIGAIIVSVISFFLIRLINDHDKTKVLAVDLKMQVAVLQNDHVNKHRALEEKIEELCQAIKENTAAQEKFREFVYQNLPK